ncbi:MAG: chromosome partitioning protein ParB, partial [Candidatus Cloacimonadota bacterium]
QPTVDVCDYRNVIIDPTCKGDLTKAGFIIYVFDTSLSELKKEGKYTNLDKINLETNSVLSEPDFYHSDETSFEFSDEPRKKIVAYEYWGYWDIDGTGMTKPFVATWVGSTMIRMEESPFPDNNLPFVTAQYLPKRRENYGEPDGELLEDNQKIVGAVTRGMIDIMARSANGQMGTRKDALDISNKRKFDRGMDYEYNSQVDPRLGFHMHTYPEIPQSAGLMLQLQNNEAESLTGVKAFSTGITGNALGDSVGGIKSAMDATSKREFDILRRLAEGIKQIGRKIIAMNAVFLDDEEVVRITNNEFITVKRDDLEGNIDLSLTISTPEADNDKAKELAFMLQTTAQSMGSEFSQLILSEIATLRKMPVLAKAIKDFQPQPDPLVEKAKELEIAKLEAEIQKLHSEAGENQANGQLDQAKVQSELAKAKKLSSEADAIDLDFVEQETGTKHNRDVDVVQSQAEANTRMKVIDNLTKPKKETSTSK